MRKLLLLSLSAALLSFAGLVGLIFGSVAASADPTYWWSAHSISQVFWFVPKSGHMLPGADKTEDIGNVTCRPRNVFAGNASITSPFFGVAAFTTNGTLTAQAPMFQNVDTSGGNRTCTLMPSPSPGRPVVFNDTGSALDATHALKIIPSAGTINGVNNVTMTTANSSTRVYYTGTEWRTW